MQKAPTLIALLVLSAPLGAQESATVGIIDFYGLRSITEDEVRAVLPFSEGYVVLDDSSFSEVAIEAEMAEALSVSRVELSLTCCYEPYKLIAYVGVEDSPA